jgi:hypothetical protein
MGLLKKIKKTVRKVVPKEVAGIMTAAAPFVAPYSLPAAAALTIGGQLKQTGRINPIVTGMSLLPGVRFQGGQGLGAFKPTGFTRFGPQDFGSGISARQLLFGGPGFGESGKLGTFGDKAEAFLFGSPADPGVPGVPDAIGRAGSEATQGLLGFGGEFGTGGSLISSMKGKAPVINKSKIAGFVAAGASLATTQEEIKEEGDQLGLPDAEIARLQAEAAEVWQDFDTTAFRPKITAAIGGLMRKNLREGSKGEGDELPPDPTTPVNPFKPKPIGPVLPDKMMASDEISIGQIEMLIERGADNDLIKEITGAADGVINQIRDAMRRRDSAAGGLMRTNFALGTRPTKQESGLGGLPIEADMRYSGGFMPYGKKEKADDVPARLSKNEFVFTADAVRAAGGGNINTGARRMYNTMKQLESMGRA